MTKVKCRLPSVSSSSLARNSRRRRCVSSVAESPSALPVPCQEERANDGKNRIDLEKKFICLRTHDDSQNTLTKNGLFSSFSATFLSNPSSVVKRPPRPCPPISNSRSGSKRSHVSD